MVDKVEHRPLDYAKIWRLAQGTNTVRQELGLPETRARAADPSLQTDIVPWTPDR